MSNKWHEDHKKAIDEKWVQRPQMSARAEELRRKWATGQIGINALCKAHAHAEKEITEIKQELAEARAEIERLDHHRRAGWAEIKRKDKLIEQTREALRLADDLIDDYAMDYEHRDNVDDARDKIKAALSAAERGEG